MNKINNGKLSKLILKSVLFFILLASLLEYIGLFKFDFFLQQNIENSLQTPSIQYLFGTDHLGRDLFKRSFLGLWLSTKFGIFTSIFSCFLAIMLSLLNQALPRLGRKIFFVLLDIYQSIPNWILACVYTLAFRQFFTVTKIIDKHQDSISLVCAIGLVLWMNLCRQISFQLEEERNKDFISASFLLGANQIQIFRFHYLRLLMPYITAWFSWTVSSAILMESALSMMGLGLGSPWDSLGVLVQEAWQSLGTYPHLLLGPASLLLMLSLFLNIMNSSLISPETKMP